MIVSILRGLLGLAFLLAIAFLLSSDRKKINWRLVVGGIVLQLVLAVSILNIQFVYNFFNYIAEAFTRLLTFTDAGTQFVFGNWPDSIWISTPDESGNLTAVQVGFLFAVKVLPTVIFFSAFSTILFYFGILQKVIYGLAWVMGKFMKLSGAESIAAAANVFIGQTEAPLVIKPYLDKMSKSEIMCLMTGGMATIAGGVFAMFVKFLGNDFAIHFLTASIISAPAAIVTAKILVPETNHEVNTDINVPKEKLGSNLLDAISVGTSDGLKLAVNVGAMLMVFISLVALLNYLLFLIGDISGLNTIVSNSTNGQYAELSMEYVLGLLFAPVAWLLGVPSSDILAVGQLLGKKSVINEVVAYIDLSTFLKSSTNQLSHKSVIIATYALCGFANFASIGIQIGGIGAIAPSQRENLAKLGFKALIGGTIASFMTAAIAGMLF